MAKYLLLKHYRGAPASVNDAPMEQWTPEELSAHVQYMDDFAARLEGTGEFVDAQALSPEGTFVRYDGEGRPDRVTLAVQEADIPCTSLLTRLIIESREGRDELDRQVLISELRHRPGAFGYDHMPPYDDPLLWIADAWCSSAGGA